MLTVSSLLSDCGLELAAGESAGGRGVRWVAISEHEDPTPWLSGGEVLLTTGYNLDTQKKQRAYVARLAKHERRGARLRHRLRPQGGSRRAIVEAAEQHEMPLFEVPYEMPFIAITERAATRLVNEQYDALARGSKVHEQLERLVIDGGGLDEITRSIAGAVGGSALVFDAAVGQVARHPEGSPGAEDVERITEEISGRLGSSGAAPPRSSRKTARQGLVVPVPGRRGAPPAGWLVVISERGELGEFERLIARQASIVVGLELMRERVVNETERRLAGDLLADALSGRLDPEELGGTPAAVRDRCGGLRPRLLARRPSSRRGGAREPSRSRRRPGAGRDRVNRGRIAPVRGRLGRRRRSGERLPARLGSR